MSKNSESNKRYSKLNKKYKENIKVKLIILSVIVACIGIVYFLVSAENSNILNKNIFELAESHQVTEDGTIESITVEDNILVADSHIIVIETKTGRYVADMQYSNEKYIYKVGDSVTINRKLGGSADDVLEISLNEQ